MSDLQKLEATRLPFAELLGIRIVSAAPERVTAEMVVRPELCTNPAVLHGGALMAFADTLAQIQKRRAGAEGVRECHQRAAMQHRGIGA